MEYLRNISIFFVKKFDKFYNINIKLSTFIIKKSNKYVFKKNYYVSLITFSYLLGDSFCVL